MGDTGKVEVTVDGTSSTNTKVPDVVGCIYY